MVSAVALDSTSLSTPSKWRHHPSVDVRKGLRISLLYQNALETGDLDLWARTRRTRVVDSTSASHCRRELSWLSASSLLRPRPPSWDLWALHRCALGCFSPSFLHVWCRWDLCTIVQWLWQKTGTAAVATRRKGQPTQGGHLTLALQL